MNERPRPRIGTYQPAKEFHLFNAKDPFARYRDAAYKALAVIAIIGLAAFGSAKFEEHRDSENRALTAAWSDLVRGKLDGTIPLSEGETYYPEVSVVPAGRTDYEEFLQLRHSGQPINARTSPSTYYPNGKDTHVVAVLEQGRTIENVVLTRGRKPLSSEPGFWGAFRRGSVEGALVDRNGMPVEVSEDTVLAIYEDYLLTTSREPQKIQIPKPSHLEPTK